MFENHWATVCSVYHLLYAVFIIYCMQCLSSTVCNVYHLLYAVFIIYCMQCLSSTVCSVYHLHKQDLDFVQTFLFL